MANNQQFGGVPGPPVRPPVVGSVGPTQHPPPISAQFRPVVPVHPSQQYVSASHQYPPVTSGASVIMPPLQTQHVQFSPPMQQLPARPLPPSYIPPISQPIQYSSVPPSQAISSAVSQPSQIVQVPNSYVAGSGNAGMPLTSSFTYMQPSYSQPQISANTATQFQPVSQVNLPSVPAGTQQLSSGNQTATTALPVQPTEQQHIVSSSAIQVPKVQPKFVGQSSLQWLEHTSSDGRRYYYNKKTKQSTWEKPLELMTAIERADATTDWKEYASPDGRKYSIKSKFFYYPLSSELWMLQYMEFTYIFVGLFKCNEDCLHFRYFYNKVTKQSKWIIPEDLKLAREQAQKAFSSEPKTETNVISPAQDSVTSAGIKMPFNKNDASAISSVLSDPIPVGPTVNASPSAAGPCLSSLPVVDSGKPENAAEVKSPAESPSACAINGAVSGSATPTAGVVAPSNLNNLSAAKAQDSDQNVSVLDAEDARKIMGSGGDTKIAAREDKIVEQEPLIYPSKLEAKTAFKSLLESVNIESDWTWDQAMRLIINDKRYGALKSLGERKQAFNEYLSQRKKLEADERRSKHKRAREEFRKMLEEHRELTSTTRWRQAVIMFGDDERFKAVERPRDREDLFEDYTVELEKEERAKAAEELKQSKLIYRRFLESCDFITASSQWRKVQERLEADERCSRLEKIDRMEIFQEHIRDLEREEEEQRRIQKEEIRKGERKNREEFRKLMEEHIAAGTLTAKTDWREYHSKVKDLPAYLAVSSNTSGSTAKVLFEDVAEELQKQYEEDRAQIKDAVSLEKIALSSTWTLDEFKAAIELEIRSPPISDTNLKLVFDELVDKAREKEEKAAKKRKRLGDQFFNLLCSLKDITASSTWEDALPSFVKSAEYRSAGDESFFRQIFEEYITQVREKEMEKELRRKEEKTRREKDREKDRKSKDRKEKEKRHEKERRKERTEKDESSKSPDLLEMPVPNEKGKLGKEKDKRHHKRPQDLEHDLSLDETQKELSRSSHRFSSDRKRSRQMEQRTSTPESDAEGRSKRPKRYQRNDPRRRGEFEELEDGELGNT